MISADSTVTIDRPSEEVFAFVSDPTNDVKWHHNVLVARRVSAGPLGVGSTFEWDAKFLGRRKVDVVITRHEPSRFVEMDLRSGWMRATVTYVVEADGGRTLVTRRVGIPLPGPLRAAAPVVRWAATRSGAHHVEWLRDVLEERGVHAH